MKAATSLRRWAAGGRAVRTPSRVLICYDHPDDDTLPRRPRQCAGLCRVFPSILVRNRGLGAQAAVMTGFAASAAPFILMYPADDDTNAGMLDRMTELARDGVRQSYAPAASCRRGGWSGCPCAQSRAGAAQATHAAPFCSSADGRMPATDSGCSRVVSSSASPSIRSGLLVTASSFW